MGMVAISKQTRGPSSVFLSHTPHPCEACSTGGIGVSASLPQQDTSTKVTDSNDTITHRFPKHSF